MLHGSTGGKACAFSNLYRKVVIVEASQCELNTDEFNVRLTIIPVKCCQDKVTLPIVVSG